MRRLPIVPRIQWPSLVEKQGLTYHTHESGPYWDESAYYEFQPAEILELEGATKRLHELCLEAAQAVIDRHWWDRLGIPESTRAMIERSWERDDFSLYGRFDLAYDGTGPAKLLEYNADTPSSLLEASVIQWFWLEQRFPGADQWNSIHERLIEAWNRRGFQLPTHFACIDDQGEDSQTTTYLRDTALQAGLVTWQLRMEDIGWDKASGRFIDLERRTIANLFKLYPWEWMVHEEFGPQLCNLIETGQISVVEPAWKLLLSNKGLLPILWELFPGHPNLLPAYQTPDSLIGGYVKKPKLSREGQNIEVVKHGAVVAQEGGDYGEEGHVYQALWETTAFGPFHPVLGTWIVDHEPAGLGIREDSGLITTNRSRFIPHRIAE